MFGKLRNIFNNPTKEEPVTRPEPTPKNTNNDMVDLDLILKIVGNNKRVSNAKSLVSGLNLMGEKAGLNRGHRLAMYLGQVLHESGGLIWDRELWGPTPAQAKYDTRTGLGNTPVKDGDGYKYRGRGPIQITGKYNYAQFTMWTRKIFGSGPNFVENPDAVNTDPWEGIVPIWFWSLRDINRFADANDIRKVTRAINGGYNGLEDRQRWTDRASLVILGYGTSRNDVKKFQLNAKLTPDGILGPNTRAAMHRELSKVIL